MNTTRENGNVVRRMFREVEADIYVMVDGDDTSPAEYVHKLIEPVANGEADMCIGDRLTKGQYAEQVRSPLHKFGNNLVRNAINKTFNVKLTDILTGYRVFSRQFVKNMPVLSPGFELETEMTIFALDKRFRIKEIPVDFRERPEGSFTKINSVKDGYKVLKTILKMDKNYNPLKFFGRIALILVIIGLIIGIPVIVEFCKTKYITKVPSAILATGIMGLAAIAFEAGIILDTVVRQHKENFELNLLRYDQIEKLSNKNK